MTDYWRVNGTHHQVEGDTMRSVLSVLRNELGLLGTKEGCGEGRCGSCTVLLDGLPVVSCLLPVALAAGREVRTVEGLAGPTDPLNPLQQRLLEFGAVQCGACVPGVLMSLTALLEEDPSPTERDVCEALAGNICRCTGYRQMVRAVLSLESTDGADR